MSIKKAAIIGVDLLLIFFGAKWFLGITLNLDSYGHLEAEWLAVGCLILLCAGLADLIPRFKKQNTNEKDE